MNIFLKIVTEREGIAGSEIQCNRSFGSLSNEFIEIGRRSAQLNKGWQRLAEC